MAQTQPWIDTRINFKANRSCAYLFQGWKELSSFSSKWNNPCKPAAELYMNYWFIFFFSSAVKQEKRNKNVIGTNQILSSYFGKKGKKKKDVLTQNVPVWHKQNH